MPAAQDLPSSSLPFALVSAVLELPLEWIAPPGCAACDGPVARRRVFCPVCAATVVRTGADVARDLVSSPFAYGGALAEAIRRFKYGRRPDLARPLGHLLVPAVDRLDADVVVPVPLHPRRRVERGFDQAALLASHVARAVGCPLRPGALRRVRHGPPQASLRRAEREVSAALQFECDRRAIAGARVLLVDDVFTTGATQRACRAALLEGGARRVAGLALARAELGSSEDG